jgi:hydroxypyruvate reductase
MHASDLRRHRAAQRRCIGDIQRSVLQAVDPREAIYGQVRRIGHVLTIDKHALDLQATRVFLIAIGKAAAPMSEALIDLLGDALFAGVLVTKHDHAAGFDAPSSLRVIEAGHPVPDAHSIKAARAIESLLRDATEHDLILCAISGGGSALVTYPSAEVTLADLQHVTTLLLRAGADIYDLNAVRKHLDQIKGGGLARWSHGARLIALILSDVIGDDLSVIASGPTAPDPSSFADAWRVIETYHLEDDLPASIKTHLQSGLRGDVSDTPKPGDALFDAIDNIIIGGNAMAVAAAARAARASGFNTLLLSSVVQGEAREAGRFISAIAREIDAHARPLARPACVILGGETTVTVRGDGKGGRNQELALAAAIGIDGMRDTWLLSFGTDGSDGPTDAAGAIASGDTLERARRWLPRRAADYLARNDSYAFFKALASAPDACEDLIITGPTGSNVNDVILLFMF